ncbi:MAG: hypothetical protein HC811_07260 [Flammeovirgaceae bacterium]|nr:hypothetical protein [Flammeovirgaceae bacterium]
MNQFKPNQITEINEIIAEIEKAVKPKQEIGAHDKASLKAQLKISKNKKEPLFFKCRLEYSDAIVNYFLKEKGLQRSRFHRTNQTNIFLLK